MQTAEKIVSAKLRSQERVSLFQSLSKANIKPGWGSTRRSGLGPDGEGFTEELDLVYIYRLVTSEF